MRLILVAALMSAAPALAEVRSATDQGFEVFKTVTVKADAARVYAMLGRPGLWWNSEHTYSGDAKNMTMLLRPGGCFCEAVPADKGAIEHGRVIYASPGKVVRLSAAFGPLQGEGAVGALTWTLEPVEGGTRIVQSYVVGGYIRGGPAKLAPLVDMVMGDQLDRLKRVLEGAPAAGK